MINDDEEKYENITAEIIGIYQIFLHIVIFFSGRRLNMAVNTAVFYCNCGGSTRETA